jgi:hypothetical protein
MLTADLLARCQIKRNEVSQAIAKTTMGLTSSNQPVSNAHHAAFVASAKKPLR